MLVFHLASNGNVKRMGHNAILQRLHIRRRNVVQLGGVAERLLAAWTYFVTFSWGAVEV